MLLLDYNINIKYTFFLYRQTVIRPSVLNLCGGPLRPDCCKKHHVRCHGETSGSCRSLPLRLTDTHVLQHHGQRPPCQNFCTCLAEPIGMRPRSAATNSVRLIIAAADILQESMLLLKLLPWQFWRRLGSFSWLTSHRCWPVVLALWAPRFRIYPERKQLLFLSLLTLPTLCFPFRCVQ